MKFNKSQKTLFEVQNYTPSPDYYFAQKSAYSPPSQPNFDRQLRFNYKSETGPGPGQYASQTLHMPMPCAKISSPPKQNDKNIQNIHSVPSIPTLKHPFPYELTQYGDIFVRCELPEQQQHKEELNQKWVRPKVVSYKFKSTQKTKPRKKVDKQHDFEFILLDSVRNEVTKQSPKQFKKPAFRTHKSQLTDTSNLYLQLILIRQKLLRPFQNPPPGFYYDPKRSSTLKLSNKPNQFQSFSSLSKRFDHKEINPTGPGQYQLVKAERLLGGMIGKDKKLNQPPKPNIPGPGTYNPKTISKSPTEVSLATQKYPNPFGSGSKRFDVDSRSTEAGPGPGSYNTAGRRRAKRLNGNFSRAI